MDDGEASPTDLPDGAAEQSGVDVAASDSDATVESLSGLPSGADEWSGTDVTASDSDGTDSDDTATDGGAQRGVDVMRRALAQRDVAGYLPRLGGGREDITVCGLQVRTAGGHAMQRKQRTGRWVDLTLEEAAQVDLLPYALCYILLDRR